MDVDTAPLAPPREKFLPVELDELAANLADNFDGKKALHFSSFCRLFTALHRAKVADVLAELKRCYREFDPDRHTVTAQQCTAEERTAMRSRLRPQLLELLRQGNYEEIRPEELQAALNKTSPRGLEVAVDLDEFDELGLHYRGLETRVDKVRDWRKLYLKKRQWETPVYRRLFLFFQFREQDSDKNMANSDNADDHRSDFLFLKSFRDVPQSDLEMLLPNTKVRMRIFDKIKIGVTGGGGTVGGVMATITKIGAAANPFTWAIAIAGLAGIIWRQISKIFVQRTRYMADLAQQLYFCNLDNNFGALVHLSDLAHDEEAKEALLAYAYLAKSDNGLTQQQLDQQVEKHLADTYQVDVDYEVEDGVAKLQRAGLLHQIAPDRIGVTPPVDAIAQLDMEWDNMFHPVSE